MGIELSSRFAQTIPDDRLRLALIQTVEALAAAAAEISALCALGPLEQSTGHSMGETVGHANADGDEQKALDIRSDEIVIACLKKAPVAYYASEEQDDIGMLQADAPVSVAFDPLDGSSNIDTNVSIGTIFGIFQTVKGEPAHSLLRPGEEQIAAGFFVYGPQTSLLLTSGDGVEQYVLNPGSKNFELALADVRVPTVAGEYAINASNRRHWGTGVRNLIEDFQAGEDGPMGKNFNMRWVASLVADASRILNRGGIFLYPGDQRSGYGEGRLRMLYEAGPVALLIEQAGGMATNGEGRILDQMPKSIHARTPLVFGSAELVALAASYHADPGFHGSRSPLFNQRGLFN